VAADNADALALDGVAEDAIYRIALATAETLGDAFMAALVRCLHDVMPVALAFVARGEGGDPPDRARALLSWREGGSEKPIEYALEGAPCQIVYGGHALVVPEELSRRFPREPAALQSYCGVPLVGRDGKVRAHFAVFSEAAIRQPQRVEGIVRIFGMRAAAELRRIEAEAEREETFRRIAVQRQRLHQANAFKSEALGVVAHDLRNPLAAIVTRVELMRAQLKATEGAAVAASLDAIERSADRMERMIADLLEAARRDATETRLRRAPVALDGVVRAAVALVAAAAEAKAIRLDAKIDQGLALMGDEDRLTEAVVNLLTNAVKYVQPGGAVAVRARREADGAFEISVTDDGAGMSDEDLAKAFRPFQTLSARPTAGEPSTGLGLAIVRSIVEAHGGRVDAESPGAGLGATFRIRLPAES